MRRIVDLTLPIEEHWRYGIKILPGKTHANGDPWQNVSYNLESHWFTHIDFPLHFDPNGKTSDDYPLQDWAITDCLSWISQIAETIRQLLERCWKKRMKNTKTNTLTAF